VINATRPPLQPGIWSPKAALTRLRRHALFKVATHLREAVMRQVLFALFLLTSSSALADHYLQPAAGWYVILGSFRGEAAAHERFYDRCLDSRVPPDNVVVSDDIDGFTPGYHVVVIGPLDSNIEAEEIRDYLLPCVPDAYVKFGEEMFDY
jgi:hypothetical protein